MGTMSVPSRTLCLTLEVTNGDICFFDRERLELKELLWQQYLGCHFVPFVMHICGAKFFTFIRSIIQGPRSKILSGGGSSMSQIFFLGGGGGGVGEAEACSPGKIRVLVTLRYRKADLKSTNSVLRCNVFTT